MRRILAVLAIAVPFAACSEETKTPFDVEDGPLASALASKGHTDLASYEVRITNLTGGQPMTPPLVVTHRPALRLFRYRRTASLEIREIAENGNLGPMLAALDENKHVAEVVVAAGDPVPPLMPGEERVLSIGTGRGARLLSFVSMLICTNDGFAGLSGLRLPRRVGESVAVNVRAYDAGSEINTEDFNDLVPPCGPLTGVDTGGAAGTGMSNPALAEGGVVQRHRGIMGGTGLVREIHGWRGPVARVVVTRMH